MAGSSIEDVIGGLVERPLINIVDVGANPLAGIKAPYQILIDNSSASLVGFEPDATVFDELQAIKGPRQKYFPLAVGDGKRHQLRICRMSGMNSLLTPNFELLNLVHLHGAWVNDNI